jgi:hypothetical protein
MKSSLDKIRDILHLYLGCQVCREHKEDRSEKFFEYAKLVGVSQSEIEADKSVAILDVGLDHFHEWYVEETKPILRQLSSMTEEEGVELFTIERDGMTHPETALVFDFRRSGDAWRITRMDWPDDHLFVSDSGRIWKVVYDRDNGTIIDVLNHQPRMFSYLLSKHFDLFNLIPEGLAIDADTLKTTSNG